MIRFLLIDDDLLQRKLYRHLFVTAGVNLDDAGPLEALRLDWSQYDLALVDVMMPEIDGPALVQQVYRQIGEKMPPVLLFSVLDNERLRKLAGQIRETGIDAGWINKMTPGAGVELAMAWIDGRTQRDIAKTVRGAPGEYP